METYTSHLPDNYMLMLGKFRKNFDICSDPEHAFVKNTPKWLVDEWIQHIRKKVC